MCGGSAIGGGGHHLHAGLSPRVRGKRSRDHAERNPHRSIPACAGEARTTAGSYTEWTVYPRVCRGSPGTSTSTSGGYGLSPRVRGKRGAGFAAQAAHRSIPACAGEAADTPAIDFVAEVYPRVCGGSEYQSPKPDVGEGLSPRVRGKLSLALWPC